jgi:hypothetical protein
MNTDTPLSPEQQQQLAARAQADADFRARLQADPKQAIAEELGIELPEEVSDAELGQVAGGNIGFGPKPDLPQV